MFKKLARNATRKMGSTEQQEHNVCLDNFVLTISHCNTELTQVWLDCKRGKTKKTIPCKQQNFIISNENQEIEFAEPYEQISKFYFIKKEQQGQAYQKKKMDISIQAKDSNNKTHHIGGITIDLEQCVGHNNQNINFTELQKNCKKLPIIVQDVKLSFNITIKKTGSQEVDDIDIQEEQKQDPDMMQGPDGGINIDLYDKIATDQYKEQMRLEQVKNELCELAIEFLNQCQERVLYEIQEGKNEILLPSQKRKIQREQQKQEEKQKMVVESVDPQYGKKNNSNTKQMLQEVKKYLDAWEDQMIRYM